MVRKKRAKKFNISNKLAYTLIVIALVIGLGVGVIAWGGYNPSVMGHSAGELAAPSGCTANQVLTYNGTTWRCAAPTATDTRFVVNASGLCIINAPATCTVTQQTCNYDNWYSVNELLDCSSMYPADLQAACAVQCPALLCNGDTTSCTNPAGTSVSRTIYAECDTMNLKIDCHCYVTGTVTYYQEIQTPATAARCI
jgi:hypothetical protein